MATNGQDGDNRGPAKGPEFDAERLTAASVEISPTADGGEELSVEVIQAEDTDGDHRIDQLRAILVDIIDDDAPTELTQEFMRRGGSLARLIEEIMEHERANADGSESTISEVDKELVEARQSYIGAMTAKLGVRHRGEQKEEREATRERYEDAVLAKLEQVLETDPTELINVGQLPKLVGNVSFDGEHADEVEELAANHLHVMVDVLLKEKNRRDALMKRASYEGLEKIVDVLRNNRKVRFALAGTIFGATMIPKLNVTSESDEAIVEHVDTALQVIAGYIFLHDIQESGYINIADLAKQRRERRDREELASDRLLADLALRTAYNEVHYGTAYGLEPNPRRVGTDDPEENSNRFAALDSDFDKFQNEPGGWPYTGRQMLNYASRLYIHRMDQVKGIATADNRKELYLQLARDLLGEDLDVLKAEVTGNRVRRAFIRGVSLAVSAALGKVTAGMGEAAHLSKETVRTVESEISHEDIKDD